MSTEQLDHDPLTFDLETAEASQLFRRPDFVRLGATGYLGAVAFTTSGDEIARTLERATEEGMTATGHNICGFDLIALARWHGLDLPSLRGKIADTYLNVLLDDPPPSGKDGIALRPRGYYGLNETCARYGVDGKTNDAKALAKKHGGFDKIPTDDSEFRDYLRGDIEASSALFEAMPKMNAYAEREQTVGLMTAQMTRNGMRVDVEELHRALEGQAVRKAQNLAELIEITGMPTGRIVGIRNPEFVKYESPLATDAGKNAIMKTFLAEGLKERAIPTTPKTGKLCTSGEGMAELKEKIVRYGGNAKLERIIDLITSIVSERTIYQTAENCRVDDRVHPSIKPTQASGRWSVTGPGLTVFGKRGGRHVERRIMIAEENEWIMSVDLDQVDARAVAAHSQDRGYMKIFQDGLDLHGEVASQVFGDRGRREQAKFISHGWNYGRGARAISAGEGIPLDDAMTFDREMRRKYPDLVRWQHEVRQVAMDGDFLDNGFGRKMRADPRYAYTQAPALVGQGCTRDILAEGMLRLPVEIWPMLRVIVHDELVLSVPKDSYEDIGKIVKDAMTFEFMGVPITAGVSKPGRTWADVYEK